MSGVSQLEVVCLIEGIDGVTSDTTQARHSYTVDEVFFNRESVAFGVCCCKRAN